MSEKTVTLTRDNLYQTHLDRKAEAPGRPHFGLHTHNTQTQTGSQWHLAGLTLVYIHAKRKTQTGRTRHQAGLTLVYTHATCKLRPEGRGTRPVSLWFTHTQHAKLKPEDRGIRPVSLCFSHRQSNSRWKTEAPGWPHFGLHTGNTQKIHWPSRLKGC